MKSSGSRAPLIAGIAVIGLAVCGWVTPAFAQSSEVVGEYRIQEQLVGTRILFNADPSLSNFTLSVTGPNGYHGSVSSARVAPSFRLADHGEVLDGIYQFEISAATPERRRNATPQQAAYNGRDPRAGSTAYLGYTYSGAFRVVNGRIMEFDQAEQEG